MILIRDVMGRGIKEQHHWRTLFTDDIELCSTRREQVEIKDGKEHWKSQG